MPFREVPPNSSPQATPNQRSLAVKLKLKSPSVSIGLLADRNGHLRLEQVSQTANIIMNNAHDSPATNSKRAGETLIKADDENKKAKITTISSTAETIDQSNSLEDLLRAEFRHSRNMLELQSKLDHKIQQVEKTQQELDSAKQDRDLVKQELDVVKQSDEERKKVVSKAIEEELAHFKRERDRIGGSLKHSEGRVIELKQEMAAYEANLGSSRRIWSQIRHKRALNASLNQNIDTASKRKDELEVTSRRIRAYESALELLKLDKNVMEAALVIVMIVKGSQ
jgi:DNA repair exonuclease SbcCD ATPase subunit